MFGPLSMFTGFRKKIWGREGTRAPRGQQISAGRSQIGGWVVWREVLTEVHTKGPIFSPHPADARQPPKVLVKVLCISPWFETGHLSPQLSLQRASKVKVQAWAVKLPVFDLTLTTILAVLQEQFQVFVKNMEYDK